MAWRLVLLARWQLSPTAIRHWLLDWQGPSPVGGRLRKGAPAQAPLYSLYLRLPADCGVPVPIRARHLSALIIWVCALLALFNPSA